MIVWRQFEIKKTICIRQSNRQKHFIFEYLACLRMVGTSFHTTSRRLRSIGSVRGSETVPSTGSRYVIIETQFRFVPVPAAYLHLILTAATSYFAFRWPVMAQQTANLNKALSETNHFGAQQAIRLQLQHQQTLMKLTEDRKLLKQNLLLWQATVRSEVSKPTTDHAEPERPTACVTGQQSDSGSEDSVKGMLIHRTTNDRHIEQGVDQVDCGQNRPKSLSGDVNANLIINFCLHSPSRY